jgi:hypothetical protein
MESYTSLLKPKANVISFPQLFARCAAQVLHEIKPEVCGEEHTRMATNRLSSDKDIDSLKRDWARCTRQKFNSGVFRPLLTKALNNQGRIGSKGDIFEAVQGADGVMRAPDMGGRSGDGSGSSSGSSSSSSSGRSSPTEFRGQKKKKKGSNSVSSSENANERADDSLMFDSSPKKFADNNCPFDRTPKHILTELEEDQLIEKLILMNSTWANRIVEPLVDHRKKFTLDQQFAHIRKKRKRVNIL